MALRRLVLVDVAPTWHVAHMALTSIEKKRDNFILTPTFKFNINFAPVF